MSTLTMQHQASGQSSGASALSLFDRIAGDERALLPIAAQAAWPSALQGRAAPGGERARDAILAILDRLTRM